MNGVRRWGRVTLALALGAGLCLVGGPAGAQVEHIDSAPGAAGEDCVVGYGSDGQALVFGTQLEIPYPNLSGGPYVATQIDALPKARALASEAYEGAVGDIILGTSGFYPENPSTAAAYYPAVEGGKSEVTKDNAPIARSVAQTAEGKAMAWAGAFGGKLADNVTVGPSFAQSQVGINGKVLKGTDELWGYELHIGDAVISNLHSTIDYQSDGTPEGAKGTWKLEFGGIHSSGGGGSMSGDGITIQGGPPTPGPSGREQFNAGAKQLADALQQAGIGRVEVMVQPGEVTTNGPEVVVKGAGMVIRVEPTPTHGSTVHALSIIFGRNDRSAHVDLGFCSGEISTPAEEVVTGPSSPPSGDSLVPFPSAESSYSDATATGTDLTAPVDSVGSGYGSSGDYSAPADEAAAPAEAPAGEAAAAPTAPAPAAAAPVQLAATSTDAVKRGYTWFAWLALVALAALLGLVGLQAVAVTRRP